MDRNKNGKLLEKAQQEFEVFVTIDQNLPFQQELSKYSIAVVALKAKSNRYKDLLGFIESASETIKTYPPDQLHLSVGG